MDKSLISVGAQCSVLPAWRVEAVKLTWRIMHETVLLQSSARNRWPRQGRCSVVVINAVFVVNGLVTRRTRAPIPCTVCSLEFSSWGDSDSGSVRPTYNSYWRTCSYLADTTVKELGVEAFRIIYLFTLPLLCLWYICINIFLCTFVPLVLLVQFSFFFSSVLFCSHLYISFKINLVCSRHDTCHWRSVFFLFLAESRSS